MRNHLRRSGGLRIERLEDRRLLSGASPGDLLLALQNPTPNVGDQFGASLASVGENIVVGAPYDDTCGGNAGIAYVFDGTEGELLHTFPDPANPTHPALHTSDTFGASVAAVGNNVLIGVPLSDTGALDAGAAYLFDGTTGNLLCAFHDPEPAQSDHLGSLVLGFGDDVLVSAYGDDEAGLDAGGVFLFDGETGQLLQKFPDPANPTHPMLVEGAQFGVDIAVVDDHHILIGAADPWGPTAGTVYLFGFNESTDQWDLERTVENPEPNPGDRFGQSIAAAGDQVLVGASFDATYGYRTGIAYRFDTSTAPWAWLRIPEPDNPNHPTLTYRDKFGTSACAVGDNFLVGADQPWAGPGVAYLLEGSTGDVVLTVPNPEPATNDRFGNRVAALGNDVLVAAYLDDAVVGDAVVADVGCVYVFKGPEPAGGNTPPTVSPIADQTVNEDTTAGPLSFTVGDAESDPGSLAVTATSSDQTLIPDANVTLGGSGADRTIELAPAADRNGGPVTITLTVSDGTDTTITTFDVQVTPVNDAPSFTLGPDQAVPEDAGPQSVSSFAAGISPGPADESGQLLTFLVTNDNQYLFAVQPAIDPTTGRLTYTPAPDANGVAAVMVQLMDDGGTANGGVDKSPVLSFTIRVLSEQQQVANLVTEIEDLGDSGVLNGGQVHSLANQFDNLLDKLDGGKPKAALNLLGAFINHVESLVEEGVLSPEQGQVLIDAAEDLQDSILIEDEVPSSGPAARDAAFAQYDPFCALEP